MEKWIFEKRPATDAEKRKDLTLDPDGFLYHPTDTHIPDLVYPRVYVTKDSGYIPVRFRTDNYIIY